MKFFSFFLCFIAFYVDAATDPDKVLQDKVMTRADFEVEVDKYYKEFPAPQGVMVETKRLAEKVSIRTSTLTGDFYDVIYRIKPLLVENKQDFQSWYILLNALVEGRNRGFGYEQKEVDYVAYLAMKAAADIQDKFQVIWKRADSTVADDNIQQLKSFLAENADEQSLRKRHTELTTLYPKKFAPYKTDLPQNQKLASVCLNLTQNLSGNRLFNYKPFVSVTPELSDFSVQGRSSNLCIEGFDYGREYTIRLKKGLTSDQNSVMDQDYEFPIYIQHRKPQLAFREQGYVLPAKGPQLLPLNTVNLAKSYLALYRVPARNFASFAEYDNFLKDIRASYELGRITENKSEKIWYGSMTTEAAMNQTQTHGIPLTSFLNKPLDPGLYFLTAEDGDKDDPNKRLLSTQWFVVSDLGITAYKGEDGIHVFTHELSTAEPVRTEMTLVAYNNKILGKVEADSFGHAHFAAAVTRGSDGNRPRYIYVRRGEDDFTFIELKAEGFDFTDRGVEGRDPAQKINAYLYAERGVYRPAEEINLTGLVRNQGFEVIDDQKITLKIFAPNQSELLSRLLEDQGAGSYTYTYELPKAALQGQWQAKLFSDPKGDALALCTFEVNDYVPPKVDVALNSEAKSLLPDNDAVITVDAKYYYGRKASNLVAKGRADLKKATKPFKTYPDASFGYEEEDFLPLQFTFNETTTNNEGLATLRKTISTKTDVSAPLTLEIEAGVVENGGRYISKKMTIPYLHQPFYIGIIPDFKDRQVIGNNASFKVLAVDTDGIIRPMSQLKYSLLEEEQDFSWFRHDHNVNYEAMVRTRVLTQGTVNLNEVKPEALSFDIPSYGRYRLEITDPKTGLGASYRFSSGWAYGAAPDKPDLLDLHLDKKAYRPDDEIKVKVKAPFEGRVMLLAIGPHNIIPLKQENLDEGGTEFEIDIPRELRESAGFYLSATAFRPMDTDKNYMTQRAINMAWISLIKEELGTPLTVIHQKQIKSQASLDVTLSYDKTMKKPFATIAIVDESVLNLTDFKSPDPLGYFFSQQKIGYQVYDVYGKLINPFGTTLNDSVVGGGLFYGRAMPLLPAHAFKTISLFSGIVPLEAGGSHKLSFDLPDFTGKARVMAVVWDESKIASHHSTFIVKDDVVADIALPRFLHLDDAAEIFLSFTNTTDTPQHYKLGMKVSGPLQLEDAPAEVKLDPKASQNFTLKLFGQGSEGVGTLDLTMTDDKAMERTTSYDIAVRSPLIDHEKRFAVTLNQGAEKKFDASLVQGFEPSLTKTQISVGALPGLGLDAIRVSLLAYAYECVEQVTAKAYVHLLNAVPETDLKELSELVANLIGFQSFSGEFSLWQGSQTAEPWATAFTTEFLVKATAKSKATSSLYVPSGAVELALRHMRNVLQASASAENIIEQSYAQYILVLAGKSSLSQLRFFADNNKMLLNNSKLGRAFVGASYALLGETSQAFEHFNQALVLMSTPGDAFGTVLRDKIVVLALLAETTEGFPHFLSRVDEVASQVAATDVLSTQEQAWLLRLGHVLTQQKAEAHFLLKGEEYKAKEPVDHELSYDELKEGIILQNKGEKSLHAMLTVNGKMTGLPAPEKEPVFTIARDIYTLHGAKHEGALKHGESYVAVITGEISKYEPRQVLVVDRLAAGIEIEATSPNLPWLQDLTFAAFQESRDDRYIASFKPVKDKLGFKFAYLMRAITKGEFSHPAVVIENMYRPQEKAYGKAEVLNVD